MAKITMVGTGHIFRIAEPITFIIKNIWPKAVLVELDQKRYDLLTKGPSETPEAARPKASKIYARSAKYQDKMSNQNDTHTGSELLAAINAAKAVDAEVICIDGDAEKIMDEIWEEMSFMERRRYSMSVHSDNLFGMKKVDDTQKSLAENEKEYMEMMRKRYPTLVRKLIDERNELMATRIREESNKYDSMVVIVGDAHIEGLYELLSDLDIRKIRLSQIQNKESMDEIRSKLWNEGEENL